MTPGRGHGLVVGKFLPPHDGHQLVIDAAIECSTTVDVVVCDRPGQRPAAATRQRWLQAMYPDVRVLLAPDICDWHGAASCLSGCSSRWAEHLHGLGLGPWDRVFGSEDYLDGFAAALGARPVVVDPGRSRRPVSGTKLRGDLVAGWRSLHPVVQRGLTRRVVILGVESSGTTTLARDVAQALDAPWVPELGRDYSRSRAEQVGSLWEVTWQESDFETIAAGQRALEDDAIAGWADVVAPRSQPLLVCDTDVLATSVWQRRYCGRASVALAAEAAADPPVLYVLTSPEEVGFEQDGLRDGEHLRGDMHGWFREALGGQSAPWIEVVGDRRTRVAAVLAVLGPTLTEPACRNPE